MFRKALDIQKETKYSGKDIKKLNALLVTKFGESAAFGARANVFLKAEASCAQLISVKSDSGEEFCFGALDAKALERAVTAAGNGERGKVSDVQAAVLFPSLHWLWKASQECEDEEYPLNVAPVHVHPSTSRFVLNGADFMAPGLQGRQYPYPEGAVVALCAQGNPMPFAVGQWQGNRTSGIAVRVLTRFGDSLWAQNPTKPEGFTPSSILGLSGETADAEVASDGEAGSAAQKGQDAQQDEEAAGKAAGEPKEDMDALLLQSFLQAAKTTLKQDAKAGGGLKVGPVPVDVFYSQYVRPARPANSSVDVHKSSHKKVSKFVDFLRAEDLIETDKSGQVIGINRAHPRIREFSLHDVAQSGDGGGTAAAAASKSGVSSLYVEGLASSHVEFPLHLVKPELNRLFFDSSGECASAHCRRRAGASQEKAPDFSDWEVYVEAGDVAPSLKDFAGRCDAMVSKKLVDVKRLGLPSLCPGQEEDAKPLTVDALARMVLDVGTEKKQFHKVTTVSLVGEEKVSFKQGSPQRVDIRTEKRKNHNVTIMQGLDARVYGYDLAKLGDFFKKRFSVPAFLEEMGSANFLVIGGFFDRDVEQICVKELCIPEDCVENQAAGRKGDMKQRKK